MSHAEPSPATDATAGNRRVVLAIHEAVGSGDLGTVRDLVHEDFLAHEGIPGAPPGPDGFLAWVRALRAAFPDLQLDVHDVIVQGDRVATRLLLRGTHLGEFRGIPPTGRRIVVQQLQIFRLVDGRVIERWSCGDDLGGFRQLGVLPLAG